MLQRAHADNDIVTALQDEVLCKRQRTALDNRPLEKLIAVADDKTRTHKHQTNQLEQRLRQVTEMHKVLMAEFAANSRFNKINTPDFGAEAL
eukprot:2251373-Amphidinium_carterae.1